MKNKSIGDKKGSKNPAVLIAQPATIRAAIKAAQRDYDKAMTGGGAAAFVRRDAYLKQQERVIATLKQCLADRVAA